MSEQLTQPISNIKKYKNSPRPRGRPRKRKEPERVESIDENIIKENRRVDYNVIDINLIDYLYNDFKNHHPYGEKLPIGELRAYFHKKMYVDRTFPVSSDWRVGTLMGHMQKFHTYAKDEPKW